MAACIEHKLQTLSGTGDISEIGKLREILRYKKSKLESQKKREEDLIKKFYSDEYNDQNTDDQKNNVSSEIKDEEENKNP